MLGRRIESALDWIRTTAAFRLSEAVFPASCAGCGLPGNWFCNRCEQAIVKDPGPGCHRCGHPGRTRNSCLRCQSLFPLGLRQLRTPYIFEGPLRQAVHRFKYLGEYQRGVDLGDRMAARVQAMIAGSSQIDVVVPVPLHPRRLRQRGFNQSAILATRIANALETPMVEVLRRTRNTESQTRLGEEERALNVRGAFVANVAEIARTGARSALIVDDVTTTGSTLAEAANAMLKSGVADVSAVALARER